LEILLGPVSHASVKEGWMDPVSLPVGLRACSRTTEATRATEGRNRPVSLYSALSMHNFRGTLVKVPESSVCIGQYATNWLILLPKRRCPLWIHKSSVSFVKRLDLAPSYATINTGFFCRRMVYRIFPLVLLVTGMYVAS